MRFADYPDHIAQEIADERDDFMVMISEPPMDDGLPEGWQEVEPDWDAMAEDRQLADEGAFL